MTSMPEAFQIPFARPLTAADLEEMPDDGHRYEVIDGALIVTPSPAVPHQVVVGNLYYLLRQSAPEHLRVMLAPLDVTISVFTVLQPDVLVAPRSALQGPKMVGIPLLAVEVLSPSTRLIDLNLKKAAFERARVESYWVVDPESPQVTVFDLVDGTYQKVFSTRTRLTVDFPYPIELDVSALLD